MNQQKQILKIFKYKKDSVYKKKAKLNSEFLANKVKCRKYSP